MDPVAHIPAEVLALVESLRARGVQAVEERIGSEGWNQLNEFDKALAELPQCGEPDGGDPFVYNHQFTPGLYIRTITMPGPKNGRTGALLTSGIHLFEHPFVITRGVCSVWSDDHGWQTLRAGHIGITKPGTRRLLYIHEETVWTTFHVTDKTDPEEIIRDITYDHLKLGHLSEIPAERNKHKELIS